MEKKYEIVSLGMNCLARYILTIKGLKPRREQGELTCPFDISVHPIKTIVNALKNDFKDYFDDIYYRKYKKCIFDFRGKGHWEKPDGTCFIHDRNYTNKEALVAKLKSRVDNLHKIIDSDLPVLFVIYIYSKECREYINELYDALDKLVNKRKKFILAVLDFNGIAELNYNPNIKVLNMEPPIPNFCHDWIRKKFIKSPFGKYIYQSISAFIKNVIDTEFIEEKQL